MEAKDLRKLNRSELLEMLIEISEENEDIKAQNIQLQEKIQDRKIELSKVGTIAEAAMLINGVFAAAQAASEQYLENVKNVSADAQTVADSLVAEAKQECLSLRASAKEETDNMRMQALTEIRLLREKTEEETDAMIEQAKQNCEHMKKEAQRETNARWAELKTKLDRYVSEHDSIMSQFRTLYGNTTFTEEECGAIIQETGLGKQSCCG